MRAVVAVQRGRRLAEDLMVDRVTITRAGATTFDPTSGLLSSTPTTVETDVPCRVRVPTTAEASTLFGEEQVTVTRYIACIPFDAGDDLAVYDVLVVDESVSCDLVGRRFRILSLPSTTFTLYRMIPCQLVE